VIDTQSIKLLIKRLEAHSLLLRLLCNHPYQVRESGTVSHFPP
jgi:hypothetical protein